MFFGGVQQGTDKNHVVTHTSFSTWNERFAQYLKIHFTPFENSDLNIEIHA